MQYVGQTENKLKERFVSHFWHIRRKKLDFPIGKHFNTSGHNGLSDVEIHILEFIIADPANSEAKRLRAEHKWIHKLKTLEPRGLNSME